MEGTKVMMSLYEAKTAKKVYLYRNGASHSQPKCLVVNDRQVRDFSTFLNRVTSGLKAPVAIRNIYTPSGGHKVKNLHDLRSGHYYVAGGAEHFKKVKYGDSPPKLLSRRPPRTDFLVPPRVQQAVVASARYKKPVEKPFVIHVFRNGDEHYRGARVLLTRRIMGSWDQVLEIVADKVNLFTPIKRLCTLDGRTLHAVSELQDGGKYVAIEGTRPFQRVSYCATEERKLLRHTTIPRIAVRFRRRSDKHHTDTEQDSGSLSDSNKTPFLTMSLQRRALQRRASRPMAGRKNKEAREKAMQDHRADSIFGGSPTCQLPSSPPSPQPAATHPPTKQPVSSSHPLNQSQTSKSLAATTHTTTPLETTHAAKSRVSPEVEKKSESSEVAEEELMSSKDSNASKRTGLFHAPDSSTQPQKQHSQEYTEDTQGDTVFKAKAESNEVQDAEVVVEGGDTEVEKPVDLEEAEEITEEENDEKADTQTDQTTHDVELKTQPLQTSIDLSLNRNIPDDNNSSSPTTQPAAPESAPVKEPTLATSSVTSIPPSHDSKTNSSVKIDNTESVAEEIEQSRTHSVLSKKEDLEEDKADDDLPEEIKEEIDAPVPPEEVRVDESQEKSSEEKSNDDTIHEELDNEHQGDTSIPDENESEPKPPTEEPVTQHTDSPTTKPEEVDEEIKEPDVKPDTPSVVEELVTEEVDQDTGSQDHKDSTASQPEDTDNTATFVVEDPTS